MMPLYNNLCKINLGQGEYPEFHVYTLYVGFTINRLNDVRVYLAYWIRVFTGVNTYVSGVLFM